MKTTTEMLDIAEVQPLSESDKVCLDELQQVLQRHGATGRFGISLLHKHFPVGEDEIMVEGCDHKTRTLTMRPMKKAEAADLPMIDTNWHFADGKLKVSAKCRKSGPQGLIH